MIKNSIQDISYHLSTIINKSISEGVVPDQMKISKVTPIFKDGSQDDFSNYRPINILPAINKIIEKIVNNQLVNYIEENNILSKTQYGFRRKYNTNTALFDFYSEIQMAKDHGNKVGIIFIEKSLRSR